MNKNKNTFEACAVHVVVELPPMDSCERRLALVRGALNHLDDQTLRYMSRLYENDGAALQYGDASVGFKVRGPETEAIVQVRIDFYDGIENDATHFVGVVADKNYLSKAKSVALGWWRQNLERFDCVSRVTAIVTPMQDHRVQWGEVALENRIWEEGRGDV